VSPAPGRPRVSAPRLDPAQQVARIPSGPLVLPRRHVLALLFLALLFSCITQTWLFIPPLLFLVVKVKYGNL
jgi:hypothetical protein